MQITVGDGQVYYIDDGTFKDFTALSENSVRAFPEENATDVDLVFKLLATEPAGQTEVLSKALTNMPDFLRVRHLALEVFGLKIVESCFRDVFFGLINQPNSKLIAKVLGFHDRGFTTKEEEKYIDRDIHRCGKKLKPIQLVEVHKAQ
jgi:hypothetical protein